MSGAFELQKLIINNSPRSNSPRSQNREDGEVDI